jgi:hypothetical protein
VPPVPGFSNGKEGYGVGQMGLVVGPVCGARIAGFKMYMPRTSVLGRGNGLKIGGFR